MQKEVIFQGRESTKPLSPEASSHLPIEQIHRREARRGPGPGLTWAGHTACTSGPLRALLGPHCQSQEHPHTLACHYTEEARSLPAARSVCSSSGKLRGLVFTKCESSSWGLWVWANDCFPKRLSPVLQSAAAPWLLC